MKLFISNNILLNYLKIVKNIIRNNISIPILNNILIKIKNNKLYIIGSDLESYIQIKVTIDNQENKENNIIIPIKIMLNTLKTFSKNELLNLYIKKNILYINLNKGQYVISSKHQPRNYPCASKITNYHTINIDQKVLYNALSYTLFTVNNDEIKPTMNGVFLKIKKNKITCVSTDSKRLVKYSNTIQNINNNVITCIIPKKPLLILKNILLSNKSSDYIKLYYNDMNNITFKTKENITISCKSIEGIYPNYNAVIPIKNKIKIMLNRLVLLNTIKRISLFTDQINNKIQLYIDNKKIIITSQNNINYKAYEYIEHNNNMIKNFIKINFNAKSIIELLSNMIHNDIILELNNNKTVGVIKIQKEQNHLENIIMLIMPLV